MIYQNPYKSDFRITCPFRKVGSWKAGFHIGVDLVGNDKKIYPICEGTVQSINSKGTAYGNHILIKQSDGKVALYAHLKTINVSKGQKVSLDTNIGVEGSTGNSTGSHLHLELHNGEYRYPKKGEGSWLLDPLAEVQKNTTMSLSQSVEFVKGKAKISNETITFLLAYKYGDDLICKLAQAMK